MRVHAFTELTKHKGFGMCVMYSEPSGWRSKQCALQVRIFFEDTSSLQLFSPASGGNQVPVFSTDG